MKRQSWEQQSKETSKAYAAYCFYRNLGVSRSLAKAYKAYLISQNKAIKSLAIPLSWKEWSKEWDWPQRNRDYDGYMEAKERKIFEAEKIKDKKVRIQTNQALRSLAIKAMGKLKTSDANWTDITNALKLANAELRKEFDDEPTQKVEGSNDVIVKVIKSGPDGVSFDDL